MNSDGEYNKILKEVKLKWLVKKTSKKVKQRQSEIQQLHESVLMGIAENEEEKNELISEYRAWLTAEEPTRSQMEAVMFEKIRRKVDVANGKYVATVEGKSDADRNNKH